MDYYKKSVKQVLSSLNSNTNGLTSKQVKQHQSQFGLNQLTPKKKKSALFLFLNQFKSFIIYILLFAIAVAILSGEFVDAIVILILVLFNAFFGFIQEYRAGKALEALKQLSGLHTTVLREGKQQIVESKDIVPGDIILFEQGTKIPADARIIEAVQLQVSESSLTGESVSISKVTTPITANCSIADQKNMVFSGTIVVGGHGKAIVTATGMQTKIGSIASMVSQTNDGQTPLQKKLDKFGKWIGIAIILICIVVFITGAYREDLFSILFTQGLYAFIIAAREWFLIAVSLAVAAVPSALPAIVTIALAFGVKSMVKKNTLVRRLPSVETLGETTVICSDKTGTLTTNQMTVKKAFVNNHTIEFETNGYSLEGTITNYSIKDSVLFQCGLLCNNATVSKTSEITGDPTEASLIVSGLKTKVPYKGFKRIEEIPFDSIRKMMSVVCKKGKQKYVFTKGAPGFVLEKCSHIDINGVVKKLTPQMKKKIITTQNQFASEALRVLGFAYKKYTKGAYEEKLIFIGLQGMIDPPHKQVPDAIATCHDAGIRVIMITGDNIITAKAIAKEIGIQGEAITGSEFISYSKKKQLKVLKKISIFSRVDPEHKMKIVSLLQEQDHIVTMTGDGVNDAPAITKADLGISMGITGTDVAKESSDMVLLDDNFTSIVYAVQEGRGVYENISKSVNYLLSSNLAEVLIIFISILLGLPLPMTAIMLLWLNLVTDGLPALALSADPASAQCMKKPPKKASEGILNTSMSINIVFISVLITISVLCLFYWADFTYAPGEQKIMHMQTLAFTALIAMEIIRLQIIRSEYGLRLFSNKYLMGALLVSLALQLAVIYTPLSIFFGTVALTTTDWVAIGFTGGIVWILTLAFTFVKDKVYDDKIKA